MQSIASMSRRHRGRRAALALAIVLIATATAVAKPDTTKLATGRITVTGHAIDGFVAGNPAQRSFGRLLWRGGLELRSESAYFGGLSGLVVSGDGTALVAVSDSGSWLRARLLYKGRRLAGLDRVEIGPLKALEGKPLTRDRDRDAEAVSLVSGNLDGGELLIGFEQNRRIGRFAIGEKGIAAPKAYLTLPPDVKRLSSNKSLESTAFILAGPLKGAVVTFGERAFDGGQGDLPGWIVKGKASEPVTLTAINGFDVTDMAALPDGGVAVLERRFRWLEGVQMRIRRIGPEELAGGGRLNGEVLIEADQGYAIDNMEGIAAHRGAKGETILTLVSDDNFSGLQRTLLLQFAIADEEATE
jgi:hypothetical protein